MFLHFRRPPLFTWQLADLQAKLCYLCRLFLFPAASPERNQPVSGKFDDGQPAKEGGGREEKSGGLICSKMCGERK